MRLNIQTVITAGTLAIAVLNAYIAVQTKLAVSETKLELVREMRATFATRGEADGLTHRIEALEAHLLNGTR